MAIQTRNPATGEVLKTFEAHSDAQVDAAITRSVEAHTILKSWTFEQRSEALCRAADILEAESHALSKVMTLEMGKTHKSAIAEVEKCAWVCRYYADTAKEHLADETIESSASKSYRTYLPLGPCAGRYALELSPMAGISVRRARFDGGK